MRKILLLCAIALPTLMFSQTELKVMSYNVLNYPTGGNISNREDTLGKILDYYMPDIMLLQELKTEGGLEMLVEEFNEHSSDTFVSGTYEELVSNPNSSWPLQQNIIYNTRLFGLADESVVTSTYRDINYFKLFLKETDISTVVDTTFLHVYVTHLKSSQGVENEQLRLEMAQAVHAAINTLPAESMIILGGDFNVYSSAEPGYQQLLAAGANNTLVDPIDMPGEWHSSSFPNKEVLTQSTRGFSLSDGAGGGMDDRFDFILLSEALMGASSAAAYATNSYKAMGNSGDCYNESLLDCIPGNELPESIVRALYYMSDHLPIIMSLETELVLNTIEIDRENQVRVFPNPSSGVLDISGALVGSSYTIYSAFGQVLQVGKISSPQTRFFLDELDAGIYFIKVKSKNGAPQTVRWIKQ